jgi:hypothetical protein
MRRRPTTHAYRCLRWGIPDDVTAIDVRVVYYEVAAAVPHPSRMLRSTIDRLNRETRRRDYS